MPEITKDDVVQIVNDEIDKRVTELAPSEGEDDSSDGTSTSKGPSGQFRVGADPLDPDMNRERFKNRRHMAWISLISNIVILAIVLFFISADKVDNYSGIINTYFMISTSIIMVYIGAAAWSYNSYLRSRKGNSNG